jgi:hypothetical protein
LQRFRVGVRDEPGTDEANPDHGDPSKTTM